MPARLCLQCYRPVRSGFLLLPVTPTALQPQAWLGGRARTWSRKVLARTGGRCVVCGSTDRVEARHPTALADGRNPDGPG